MFQLQNTLNPHTIAMNTKTHGDKRVFNNKNKNMPKCKHEDNCIYDSLEQLDGKPIYVCHCGDCGQKFIIKLEEGDNKDISEEDYNYIMKTQA